jgi:LasA protease
MFGSRCITTISLLLVTLISSCATSGYWIPPSAQPTQVQYANLFSSIKEGAPFISPTPQVHDPLVSSNSQDEPANSDPELAPTHLPANIGSPGHVDINPSTLMNSTPTTEISTVDSAPILYYAQAADTLPVVAVRFGVLPSEITSQEPIPETGFINPSQLLVIPRRLADTTSSELLLPDSEVVFSPSAVSFDAQDFANQADGYLSSHSDFLKSTGVLSGAQMVTHVSTENSINPRLLLALLEYHSNWVYGQPVTPEDKVYPLGVKIPNEKHLYHQLVWTVNQLSIGYYAYREGRFTEITFADGSTARLAPDLNAGTAALQYYFAQFYQGNEWYDALYSEGGFISLYKRMFGDPWQRAKTVEPLYPTGAKQPSLILPFERNWTWSYTGGPHGAWERDGAYAALDFGPGIQSSGCVESGTWALAAADGLVVRTGKGLVVLDLDGDGHEQTGWVLVYMHIESKDRIPLGTWVATGDKLGHPSCEGGFSTGTHLHIARKYNGEWVPADGPLPFNLGGWIAHAGKEAYKGTLTRDGETVTACTCSNAPSFITRTDDDP